MEMRARAAILETLPIGTRVKWHGEYTGTISRYVLTTDGTISIKPDPGQKISAAALNRYGDVQANVDHLEIIDG